MSQPEAPGGWAPAPPVQAHGQHAEKDSGMTHSTEYLSVERSKIKREGFSTSRPQGFAEICAGLWVTPVTRRLSWERGTLWGSVCTHATQSPAGQVHPE